MNMFITLAFLVCSSAFAQSSDYFNTQVTEELRITGSHCRGGGRFSTRSCTDGEWYTTLTSKNGSTMFLSALDQVEGEPASASMYFAIRPLTPVSDVTKSLIEKYWVRFEDNGSAQVLEIE